MFGYPTVVVAAVGAVVITGTIYLVTWWIRKFSQSDKPELSPDDKSLPTKED